MGSQVKRLNIAPGQSKLLHRHVYEVEPLAHQAASQAHQAATLAHQAAPSQELAQQAALHPERQDCDPTSTGNQCRTTPEGVGCKGQSHRDRPTREVFLPKALRHEEDPLQSEQVSHGWLESPDYASSPPVPDVKRVPTGMAKPGSLNKIANDASISLTARSAQQSKVGSCAT